MKNKLTLVAQIILGFMYFFFGLAGLLNWFTEKPPMPQAAMDFAGALFNSGYFFQFLKGTETVAGFFLLVGIYSPVALAVLAPITINIFLFHAILTPGIENLWMALIITVLHGVATARYWNLYRPLFKSKY